MASVDAPRDPGSSRGETEIQTEIYTKFFHGLSNPTRFRIVEMLLEDEMNVSQIMTALGISQSQASNQLACLKWCGYVASRPAGKYVVYRIADPRVRGLIVLVKEIAADNAERIHACTKM